jgi:type VI secretion system protein VasD
MNPDVTGRPSPVLLRLYELKAPANFDQADFFSLYQQAQDVLGADLLARDEFLLRPGETRTLERVVEPDARYLGLLAAYRDLDHALWHAVIPLTPHARSQVRVDLGRLALTVHGPSK